MGQTMRHSMPIYAHPYADTITEKDAQVPVSWGLGIFSYHYSSTIGVCAERSDIQGLTAGGLVANCETRNGTGFLRLLQGVWVGQNFAPRGDCIYLGRAALCTLCKNAT